MQGLRLWMLGLIPLVGLGMLAVGVSQGTVPFTHLRIVGIGLVTGALLLGTGIAANLRRDSLRSVVFWAVVALAVAEGAGGAWFLADPAGAGATLVRANRERMGELLVGYVGQFGEDEHVDGLVARLLEEAPFPQIIAYHQSDPAASTARGVPDAFVTRLSHEHTSVILEQLDGAFAAFGNQDGQLAPLAAVLDQHARDLDHAAMAVRLPLLYDLAPPGSPYGRLGTQIGAVAAEEVEVEYDALLAGDRALADLVIHARDHGNHVVLLDARGAPGGLEVLDEDLRHGYLRPEPGGGGGKVIRLRYRELRRGEIVETAAGPRPVDLVTAELMIRVELDGVVRYERTFEGASPEDAWKTRGGETSLREHYRQAAVAQINTALAEDFARARVR